MQPTHTDDETDQNPRPSSRRRSHLIGLLLLFLGLLLLGFLPPLVNVSRFQLRIARNISATLGRPVHFDRVSLMLLPMPGFTLDNFVVEEAPAFGSEPILRAGQVRVTLRISSLWHHRVEFSRIAFSAGDAEIPPSVNLVQAANGKWNIESLLLQASRIEAAPTGQRFAGPARRVPYIEATGARVNLKLDQEKTPFSLADADFALWLPEPHQWHLRLETHLIRTDTSPGDTGTVRVEGTLGGADMRAATLADTPLDLHGDWQDAQLGGLSRLLFGHDSGLRGDISLSFGILGTVGHNAITTNISLAKARRADFVPQRPLSLEANCNAVAGNTFHSFSSIECHWPRADSSDPSILILTADLPDVRQPDSASANITLPALPAQTLLDWLSIATPHPPTGLAGPGTLAGTIAWHPDAQAPATSNPNLPQPDWSGELEFSGESLDLPALGPQSIPLGDVLLRSTPSPHAAPPRARSRGTAPTPAVLQTAGARGFDLLPIALPLGGKQPAILEGHFDADGYALHLTGSAIPARILALGDAIPQFGDGLGQLFDPTPGPLSSPSEPVSVVRRGRNSSAPEQPSAPEEDAAPIHIDLTATRDWGGPQVWRENTPQPSHRPAHN